MKVTLFFGLISLSIVACKVRMHDSAVQEVEVQVPGDVGTQDPPDEGKHITAMLQNSQLAACIQRWQRHDISLEKITKIERLDGSRKYVIEGMIFVGDTALKSAKMLIEQDLTAPPDADFPEANFTYTCDFDEFNLKPLIGTRDTDNPRSELGHELLSIAAQELRRRRN